MASLLLWGGLMATHEAAPPAAGQMDMEVANPMTDDFNQGMGAFEKHDWTGAIALMEKVLANAETQAGNGEAMAAIKSKLAPVYYMIGAAAFNVPDPIRVATSQFVWAAGSSGTQPHVVPPTAPRRMPWCACRAGRVGSFEMFFQSNFYQTTP
jgi:hypothetical protein